MKIIFKCEKCLKTFDNQNECETHEKNCVCHKKFPIKAFYIERRLLKESSNFTGYPTISIYGYPNAELKDEFSVILLPNSNSILHLDTIQLDEIHDNSFLGNTYCIYTTNFSKEYEKECIEKLLNYRKAEFESHLKLVEKNIKNIDDKNYYLDINENANMVMDGI